MTLSSATLAYLGVTFGAISTYVACMQWFFDWRFRITAKQISKIEQRSTYISSFNDDMIANSLSSYVIQDCGQLDPSHESDLTRVVDIRENSFKVLMRFLAGPSHEKHVLILADSGMGKTSLCLNFYAHLLSNKIDACLFSLARPDAMQGVAKISNKRSTVCIIDALDEDALAILDMNSRLLDIFSQTADFKTIILTCRSQFFRDQASIPTETNVFVVGPRAGGVGATHKVLHLFLLPFDKDQINKFVNKQFRISNPLNFANRVAARQLINRIPELSVRPMLLDLLPDLVREEADAQELYDLYSYLVQQWCDREKEWIIPSMLKKVSARVAVAIHKQSISGKGDRITIDQLHDIAKDLEIPKSNWSNLSIRSLLNRDREGLHKFAHRSVMEYFYVRAALEGDDSTLELPWTDVMRELLVSWGYTTEGNLNLVRANEILSHDLRATTLIPLSEAPQEPSVVTLDDVVRATARRSRKRGGRRRANPRWRENSISYSLADDIYVVEDKDSDLSWIIPDFEELLKQKILDSFYSPLGSILLGEYNSKLADGDFASYRLPSLEEFLSLIEALDAIDRAYILPEYPLYVIGDLAGARRHLLVSLDDKNISGNGLAPFDLHRSIEGTNRNISIYEAGVNVDLAGFSSVKAIALHVRRGLTGKDAAALKGPAARKAGKQHIYRKKPTANA